MNKKKINYKIRTRFAPSPTGYLHIGGARTALFSWAYAKKFNGLFFLRIEDTDIKRSTNKAKKNIIESMKWLNLKYNKKIVYQSKRIEYYHNIAKKMIVKGIAYYCYSSSKEIKKDKKKQIILGIKPKYNNKWRPEIGKILPKKPHGVNPSIRFKNPQYGHVIWQDLIKGQIKISNEELDDLIIIRSNGIPTYNFCSIIDDIDMKITHVIRGDDHINNTPRQINIAKALNKLLPKYAHIPMILSNNGEKLSKRNDSINIMDYNKKGFLSKSIINYISRLGWSYKNNEIFSINQFCNWFDFKYISKSPAKFDEKKLFWINKYYIKLVKNDKIVNFVYNFFKKKNILINFFFKKKEKLYKIIKLFKNRVNTICDFIKYIKLFFSLTNINKNLISKYITNILKIALHNFIIFCKNITWKKEEIDKIIKKIIIICKLNMYQLALILRIIITGKLETPAISSVLEIFEKKFILTQIKIFLKNN